VKARRSIGSSAGLVCVEPGRLARTSTASSRVRKAARSVRIASTAARVSLAEPVTALRISSTAASAAPIGSR